jgi:hypothetical protein
MSSRRATTCVAASLLLMTLSLAFAGSDSGALLCISIAFFTAVLLLVRAFSKKGRQRLIALAALAVYLPLPILVLTHYSLVRDDVRWSFLAGRYKARVLAQPTPPNGGLKHSEWDYWGFAGIGNTTVFLVLDPTDSLSQASGAKPPVKTRGLPCEVHRVHRLARQWYTVEFYADTYWGQGNCS